MRSVAKTTGFAAHAAAFSSWEEDVAKLCCLVHSNGNRIAQQHFMPEDLAQYDELQPALVQLDFSPPPLRPPFECFPSVDADSPVRRRDQFFGEESRS